MDEKFQYFDGKKFTRDESTGYYLCSTQSPDGKRRRMHVYVWEFYNGPVPLGYHVHHIDEDKSNNSIENLELLLQSKHLSLHGKEYTINNRENVISNLKNNAIPKACEWHKSQEGKAWHRNHYEKMKTRLYEKKEFICENCGKHFMSSASHSRFCSNNCKSAWRKKAGIDDIVKICVDCGGEYTANKYAETKYCKLCKNKKHPRNRKGRCL